MKKLLLILVVFGLAVAVFSEPLIVWPDKTHGNPLVAGYHFPVYGEATVDVFGNITGWAGPNVFLGWTWKNYFEPLELQKANFFYEFGTEILVLPYAGIGFDYPIVLQNNQTFLVGGRASAGLLNLSSLLNPSLMIPTIVKSLATMLNIAIIF